VREEKNIFFVKMGYFPLIHNTFASSRELLCKMVS